MELRTQTEKKHEEYKKALELTNSLIAKRLEYYNSLVATMLQMEQSRIGVAQTLALKHTKYIEDIGKLLIEKSALMALVLAKINGEEDVRIFKSQKKGPGIGILFIPLKYLQYDSE